MRIAHSGHLALYTTKLFIIEKPDVMDKNELQIWNPDHQINQKIIKRA